MCGIVGIWQKDKQPVSPQLLTRMRDTMHFRGPDDAGIWLDGAIGFGHRRLSVIDLSSLGHQPMIDDETGAIITYNGEAYNYQQIREELKKDGIRFKSQTDTEVVLKAYRKWGVHCVDKFVGMFSFAIWDSKRRGIYLARDRMGIKPLYYYLNKDIFIFASRLGSLIVHPSCPRDIDLEALGLYLEMGFIPAPWSILKGVKKLKPGHTLWVDEKGMQESCYWSIDTIDIDGSLNKVAEDELVDRLDGLLQESVKSRLISDVPLGAFLSGGIDSSLIAALMCRCSETTPNTFTIGFEEKAYDESDHAGEISRYLGVNHNVRIMKSNDLLSLLGDNALYYDEPFADSSSLPYIMLSRFAKQHATVCLSGDGGDELFAGYHHYLILFYLQRFYHFPYRLRVLLGKFMARISNRRFAVIGQSFLQKDMLKSFAFMQSISGEHNRQSIFKEKVLTIENLFEERSSGFPEIDKISAFCKLDIAYFLTDDILQKVDVASMSASLEVRVPILDHRVVEFAQSLPIKYKIRGLNGKWILKKVLSRYVPAKFFNRPKRGFVAPVDRWFRGELKDVIQDELSPLRIRRFGYLEPAGVRRLLDLHLSNKCNTHRMLWAILALLRWNEHFKSQRSSLILDDIRANL